MTMNTGAEPAGLVHAALFYRSPQEYLDAVLPFVLDGLGNGEAVLFAAPQNDVELVRDALGDAGTEVTMADMTDVGRNPNRLLGIEAAFLAEHADRPVRVTGDCYGRPAVPRSMAPASSMRRCSTWRSPAGT